MTSTFNKVLISAAIVAAFAAGFWIYTGSLPFAQPADAATTCGSCGETSPNPPNTWEPTGTPPKQAPACVYLRANPTKLPYGGGNVRLTWLVENGTATLSGFGRVTSEGPGSKVVNVTKDTTFILTVSRQGTTYKDQCRVTVTVPPPQEKEASCDFFTSNKSTVPYGGGNVKLSWGTTNATNVSINNGIGSVSADGSKTVNVSDTTTFVLTAQGAGGNDQCEAKVVVKPKEHKDPSCDAFDVSPNYFNNGDGGKVTITWETTNADSVSINHGIGSVADDGSTTYNVSDTTTFTMTVKGDGKTVTCSDKVVVKDKPGKELSCDLFETSKSHVDEDEDFKLYWETTGATHVWIDEGIGSVSNDGSEWTSVSDDTTFTLTAENDDGDEVTCTTKVRVDDNRDHNDLRCELDISDDRIDEGDRVTIEWDNDGDIRDILLEDDHGHVLVDTDDGDNYDEESDEITIKPTKDTEYTLTVIGDNGDEEECDVDVEVDDDNDTIVTKHRDQLPIVLTRVPYTGFEAGPFLTGLFYTLLALWGIGVAYYVVVKRDTILAFANGTMSHATPEADMTTPQPFVSASVTDAPARYTQTASAPANLPTADVAPVIGYASLAADDATEETETTEVEDNTGAIEARAHDARVLLSSDALNFIAIQDGSLEDQFSVLDRVIANAKAMFPTENGWMVINKERMLQLLA